MGLQAEYAQRTQQLLKMAASGDAPELKDRRFSDDSWRDQNQPWGWAAALYLVNSEFLRRTAELLEAIQKRSSGCASQSDSGAMQWHLRTSWRPILRRSVDL
jgi:hypothetical protein